MYNIMVWRKTIFCVCERDCTFKHIECSMWHLFRWAMKDSYKRSWIITQLHIMFNNTYLNVSYCRGIDSNTKPESAHLNVWLIKIDLVDILASSTHCNVYIGLCIVSRYKNMRAVWIFYRLFWKN